jgi:hypothetical protein
MLRSCHCLSVSAIVTAMGSTACAPCDAGGDTTPMSACVASTQIVVDESGREALTVAGTIAAIEPATLNNESCLRSNSVIGAGVEEAADGLVSLSIQTDEEVVAVVLRLLDEVPFVAGDDVTVDYRFTFGGFGPDAGRLLLTGGNGALVYLEEAGALEGLAPPGVELARGDQRCWTHDGCGAFGRYDVVVEGDGDTTPLSIDEATVIDDVAFRASALVEQDQSQAVKCPDWFAGHVLVSGVRGGSGAR